MAWKFKRNYSAGPAVINHKALYTPQAWQMKCHRCEANELLVGGAFGPGKSTFMRHEGLNWALRIPNLQVYMFRRTFPDLEKNHIIPSLLQFPADVGKYKDQKHRWELKNGSMIHFCHCQHEKDVFDYLSAEMDLFMPDQLETFTEFQYDFLRARVRPTVDVPEKWRHKIPGVIAAANPGGVGHNFIKRRWITPAFAGTVWKAPAEEGGMIRCFIPGLLSDNPILLERDPDCINRVRALPEPYRTAYMGGPGAWDVFVGQAFDFRYDRHVILPGLIPSNAHVYMTFDWGAGAPFCVLWWWVDADGRLFCFDEWYGWNGTPNQGLRLTDSEIALGIKEREARNGASKFNVHRISGPDCFNKKIDYRGGGQGPSTAEVFMQYGLILQPGDPNRSLKIRQVRERLKIPEAKMKVNDMGFPELSHEFPHVQDLFEEEMPMMVVYNTCENFIRTIPELQMDPKNPEDIITIGAEDHCLHGDTLIKSEFGYMPIKDLVNTTGKLYSINEQLVNYYNCRLTRKNTQLVEVCFDDGFSVKCTLDHEFLLSSGYWKKAIDLSDAACYSSIKEETKPCTLKSSVLRFNNLTEKGIINAVNIFKEKARGCIELSGNIVMAQYRKALEFIISTITKMIIDLTIFFLFPFQAMLPYMPKSTIMIHGLKRCIKAPKDGMGVMREENGIKNILRKIVKRYLIRLFPGFVFNAALNFKENNGLNIVLPDAPIDGKENIKSGWNQENAECVSKFSMRYGQTLNKHVLNLVVQNCGGKSRKVVKVNPSGRGDVYCLTVSDLHCFALANGVIVSNCYDAAALMCMARPVAARIEKPKKEPSVITTHIDGLVRRKEQERELEYEMF